jgi:hypothetical protein
MQFTWRSDLRKPALQQSGEVRISRRDSKHQVFRKKESTADIFNIAWLDFKSITKQIHKARERLLGRRRDKAAGWLTQTANVK